MASPQVAGAAALILSAGDRPWTRCARGSSPTSTPCPRSRDSSTQAGGWTSARPFPGANPRSRSTRARPVTRTPRRRPSSSPRTTPRLGFAAGWRPSLAFRPAVRRRRMPARATAHTRCAYLRSTLPGHRSAVESRTWTVDQTPPVASIDSGPSGTTPESAAQFDFSAVNANPGARFRCRLDSDAAAACVSPAGYSGLADGAHRFVVRATDRAGNTSSPAVRNWVVDTPARRVRGSG